MVFAVVEAGAEVSLESLRSFGAGRLARFKLPQRFEHLDVLPRNVMGKVARDVLRRRVAGAP
jgi:fatty-acyl-CoA synthase